MNLWLMLYVAGRLAVVWPISDEVTFPACLDMAIQKKAEVMTTPIGATMEFRCEWHDDEPIAQGDD